MADNDDWVVVGGKGRPRRTPEQQQKHLEARAAAAKALVKHTESNSSQHHTKHHKHQPYADGDDDSHEFQVSELPAGASPAQYAAQQQLAILAAALAKSPPAQQQQLPGWDPPKEREWKVAGSSSSKSRKRSSKFSVPRTPEEHVQWLGQQIHDICEQVKQSHMFASLQAAMQQVAADTQLLSSSTIPSQQQQQQQQPQQQHQQLDQTEPSSSSSSSSRVWSWQGVQHLVVYGLGSPDDSRVSRYQLALVLLLQKALPGLLQPPQLYDPAFSDADRLLLQQLGMQVIETNEECRRRVKEPTLFYLPHLEGALCDNLLAANWSTSCLCNLAILGNSFTTYDVRWSAPEGCKPKTRRPDKLLQLLHEGAVLEVPVPDHNFAVASAFNDTSLHVFKAAGVTDLEP